MNKFQEPNQGFFRTWYSESIPYRPSQINSELDALYFRTWGNNFRTKPWSHVPKQNKFRIKVNSEPNGFRTWKHISNQWELNSESKLYSKPIRSLIPNQWYFEQMDLFPTNQSVKSEPKSEKFHSYPKISFLPSYFCFLSFSFV